MTEEEAKELKEATWPETVEGQTRPTDPITVDMPYSEELPQMFSGDFVGPDQPNTAYRQLLSNDKSLKDGITPVAKATQADTASACTGNSVTATKLQTARTISLTGAVTGSASFDGSKNASIATTYAAKVPTATLADTATKLATARTISLTGEVTGSASFNGSANISIATTGLIGRIEWFAGKTTPTGYLLCDGSAVSRTSYAKLYAVIGTTYGAGNGSTTFNLPCLTDGRFAEGNATPGTKRNAGLPNLWGYTMMYSYYAIDGWKNGVFTTTLQDYGIGPSLDSASEGKYFRLNFSANDNNSIYGNSDTVQPKSITLRPLIRYI